jgi:hypothetical protein
LKCGECEGKYIGVAKNLGVGEIGLCYVETPAPLRLAEMIGSVLKRIGGLLNRRTKVLILFFEGFSD